MFTSLLFVIALTVPFGQTLPEKLFQRQAVATCNRDNLYRCFTASPGVASTYCAAYTPTSTVTAAAPPPTTTTQTNTVTSPLTVTQTTTITAALVKRAASPTGPSCLTRDGSKSTSYSPSRITSACSCLYPRSTTTVTPTRSTVTVTVIQTAASTVTTVVTSTAPPPAPTCSYPLNDQRGVRGIFKPGAQGPYYTETGVADAQACYNNAKNLMKYWSNELVGLQSYIFFSDTNPGSPDGPGECRGYLARSCENLLPDPIGNGYGGDTSLPY